MRTFETESFLFPINDSARALIRGAVKRAGPSKKV